MSITTRRYYRLYDTPICHEYAEHGSHHRLVIGTREGAWAGWREIAVNGDWRATTRYYTGLFPRVFTIDEATKSTKDEALNLVIMGLQR